MHRNHAPEQPPWTFVQRPHTHSYTLQDLELKADACTLYTRSFKKNIPKSVLFKNHGLFIVQYIGSHSCGQK